MERLALFSQRCEMRNLQSRRGGEGLTASPGMMTHSAAAWGSRDREAPTGDPHPHPQLLEVPGPGSTQQAPGHIGLQGE